MRYDIIIWTVYYNHPTSEKIQLICSRNASWGIVVLSASLADAGMGAQERALVG